jgi:hypothetical protein
MKRWVVPVLIVLVIAAGVGGFFAGRAAGGQKTATTQGGLPGYGAFRGYGGAGARGAGGGLTTGSIVSKDAGSMTVKLSDGNTKIVFFSASTAVSETKDVSSTALAVGNDVTVVGTTNTDGSITATRIQLGTVPFGNGVGGGPGQTGRSSTTTAK